MLIIWTFLCELPEILTLVSTCSCFKPVVAYFKRNFMRVNFIGSSHIYYHKSNYLSLTTILTHRAMGKRKRRIFKHRGMKKLPLKTVPVSKNVKTRRGGKENNV